MSSLGSATDRLSPGRKRWDCSMYRGIERRLAPRRPGPKVGVIMLERDALIECVKRHPELPPLRHEELPPPWISWSRLKVSSGGGGTEGGGADRSVTGGRPDEATLSLGAEPVAVAANGQHVAVVQEPVEDCGGDHRIGEHHAPFGNAAVRRDQHGPGLIAPADQLEEQVCRVGLQRQVPEFVDDQQLRLRERQQFLVQSPFAMRLGEASDQRRRRRGCTVYPARIASRPSAIDRCVLPTPGKAAS